VTADTPTRIVCAPAPAGVIDDSRADVSFIAGFLVNKFPWHLPLYRQHQRLRAAGRSGSAFCPLAGVILLSFALSAAH